MTDITLRLADLEADAIRFMRDRAATNAITDHAARIAAMLAVTPRVSTAGVTVEAIIPDRRTVYRRTHFRMIYRLNGKVVTKAAAAVALAA